LALVRAIGRWTMTALVINSVLGSGIFALVGEINRLVGRASPFALMVAAAVMGIIMACVIEVASQFSEPGGPYLYTRTALGRFVGIQIGWFSLLSFAGSIAVAANLVTDYLTLLLHDAEPLAARASDGPLDLSSHRRQLSRSPYWREPQHCYDGRETSTSLPSDCVRARTLRTRSADHSAP